MRKGVYKCFLFNFKIHNFSLFSEFPCKIKKNVIWSNGAFSLLFEAFLLLEKLGAVPLKLSFKKVFEVLEVSPKALALKLRAFPLELSFETLFEVLGT